MTDKTLLSDVLTKDRLHEHLTEMTLIADRLLREEFRGSRRVREVSGSSIKNTSGVSPHLAAAKTTTRSEEYLLWLACCGGPFIHGEAVGSFEFLVYLELIPAEELCRIRGEEELSSWLDRVRTLMKCGFFDNSTLEVARTKVQQVLRQRMLSSDPRSADWLDSLAYFSGQASESSDWIFALQP
ncbi:MAG: hypothetical protein VX607_05520 [Planctomycetota bacterium]|nr:hypothetical protein [Planctomycetota bacterium]